MADIKASKNPMSPVVTAVRPEQLFNLQLDTHFTRSGILLRHFEDFHTSLVREGLGHRNISTSRQAEETCRLCLDG